MAAFLQSLLFLFMVLLSLFLILIILLQRGKGGGLVGAFGGMGGNSAFGANEEFVKAFVSSRVAAFGSIFNRYLLYGSAEYLDAAEDYAIAVTASTELFELHVIRPKSGREEEAVKLLEGRISVLRSSGMEEYDPAVYYNIIENAEPEKSDGFVILKIIRNSENQ